MATVAVKNKYHVVIPRDVREAVSVEVGDLLDAKVEAGKITFTPTSEVPAGVAESLADFAAGRSFGLFRTGRQLVDSLHRESAKITVRRGTIEDEACHLHEIVKHPK
jgi:bifunctional DNA-binding transcriptional regulator/antitoxin component of YhaV-PrlF toxin-antitoxin module